MYAYRNNSGAVPRFYLWPLLLAEEFPRGNSLVGILHPVTSARKNARRSLCKVLARYCYPILTKTGMFRQILVELPSTKFLWKFVQPFLSWYVVKFHKVGFINR
jgi:hypothetical protein